MRRREGVIGFGELILDHIFVTDGGRSRYIGSRGGGSISNILANLVSEGVSSRMIGVCGDDVFGRAALEDLHGLGVDTDAIQVKSGKRTRLIFEEVYKNRNQGELHTFSTKCLVCGSVTSDKLARFQDEVVPENLMDIGFACFDRFTRNRLVLAGKLRKLSIRTLIDIGRVGYLRYQPAARVIAGLDNFDVVVAQSAVISHLVARRALIGPEELCLLGPRLLLIVLKGEDGLECYDCSKRMPQRLFVSAFPVPEIVDDAGAGDAVIAHFLSGLRRFISSGDSLAAISGSGFGGLLRNAVLHLGPVLQTIGARGHLPSLPLQDLSCLQTFLGHDLEQIRSEVASLKQCPFCGDKKTRSPDLLKRSMPKLGARTNVAWLPNRLFLALERHDAIAQCREIIRSSTGTAVTIGTGGSYPVAAFLSQLLLMESRVFAQPMRPLDYIRLAPRSDIVIVISYSGSTADCGEAIRCGLANGVSQIFLVTNSNAPSIIGEISDPRLQVISYQSPSNLGKRPGERGFVSIIGTVAPCALWTAAVIGEKAITRFASEVLHPDRWDLGGLATQLRSSIIDRSPISVMGSGLAWPSMLDLESKFVETNLGVVQLHEMKDFSHGRFISIMNQERASEPCVYLGVGNWSEYESLLIKSMSSHPSVKLTSFHDGLLGALELLIKIQYFVQLCGEMVDKDVSRPRYIPPAGLTLYRWKGHLR